MKKKFTMLFAALSAVMGASAQTVITDVAQLSNEKVYAITPKDITRGAMYATSTSQYLDACGGTENNAANPTVTINANSADQQFALYTHEGSLYLFSVGAGKFVSDVQNDLFPLVEQPAHAVAIEASGENYFIIKAKGTEYINVSIGWGSGCVAGWNNVDEGNKLQITEVSEMPETTLQQLVAAFNKQVELTYVYEFEGETVKTETVVAAKGEAYPQPTVPFGVDYTMSAEGNVADDAVNGTEVIIKCTLNGKLPFTVSTLTDGKFGEDMSWYHLTLRGKDVTYDVTTGMALAQDVDEKSAHNYFAVTGNPFEGYSIYNYVAGDDKVLYPAKDDNGTRAYFTESASGTWLLYKNTDAGYQFRMKDVDNGWLNDHKPQLAIWNNSSGATDDGSTFTFTLVENPELTTFYEVTYEYVYGEEVKATQTTTVEEGSEYPACSYFAPYGVTVGAKPEGTVSAAGTHRIALTVEHELPFEAAVDVNSIDTWYYAQMHANSNYTAYIQDNGEGTTNIEWNDKSVDAAEIDSHLWGFAGDIWTGIKMVNKVTGRAIVSTSGDAVLGDKANATAFIPTYSYGAYNPNGWFCLKYPNSNYLNASSGKVGSYFDDDNGSSFKLTKYQEKTVVVSDVDYSTLYLDYATYIPEDVEVYTVSAIENGYVTLTLVEGNVLPANTGVILKNEGNYNFVAAGATASVTSLLSGSATDTYVEGTAYVLADGILGVGLYKAQLTDGAFLNNANKAYLVLPAQAEAPAMFSFGRGEGTTGIETTVSGEQTVVIYDLAGRRVEKMEKGIYIVNGKKVIR